MRIKSLFKLMASAAFIVVLFHKVDWQSIVAATNSIHVGLYCLSFLILLLNSFLLAIKFKTLIAPSGIQQDLLSLFRINLICRFYAFFLTPFVGQGLIRWYRTTKNQLNRGNFLTVMLLERTSFLLVLCLALLLLQIVSATSAIPAIKGIVQSVAAAAATAMVVIIFYLFSPKVNFILNFLIAASMRWAPKSLMEKFFSFSEAFSLYLSKIRLLFECLAIAVIWHLLYLLRVYLLSLSINVPLDFFHISWMASLVLLLQTLPITLNGIGLRESAYAALFSLAELSPEDGVVLGLLFLSQMLVVSFLGGIVALFEPNGNPRGMR